MPAERSSPKLTHAVVCSTPRYAQCVGGSFTVAISVHHSFFFLVRVQGNYVYVGQVTSPYIQGCFGPVDWTGSSSGKTPECSTNARAINDFAYSSYTFNSGSTMNAVEVEAETEEAIEEEASL